MPYGGRRNQVESMAVTASEVNMIDIHTYSNHTVPNPEYSCEGEMRYLEIRNSRAPIDRVWLYSGKIIVDEPEDTHLWGFRWKKKKRKRVKSKHAAGWAEDGHLFWVQFVPPGPPMWLLMVEIATGGESYTKKHVSLRTLVQIGDQIIEARS